MAATLVAGPDGGRLAIVDVARGLAIAQMIAYHFCYDLNHFAWIHVQMNSDVRWLSWRTAIVAQFLFLVGVSLALRAGASGNGIRPNWRRWGQIAACAALVSIASWYMFGARWIWFGVLHFVAVAQLLAPRIARYGAVNLALGVILIAIGCSVHLAPFAAPALSWLGFSPVKPHTEDFVPLLPWSGVVLLGIGAAVVWQRGPHARAARWRQPQGRWWRVPALLGRWPLTTYMVHQPVLFGVLSLVARH
jgi:uncharacterized membrane protein